MIKPVKNKKHLIIKRDGRLEPYNPNKLKRAIDWCTKNNEILTNELFKSIDLKIYDKMKIEVLWDTVISTAASKINELYLVWDSVARRALLLKIYKEVNNYDNYLDVIKKGIQYRVYNKNVIDTFTEEELIELSNYIKPDRDFNFTFSGLNLFMQKYAMKHTKNKILELPQHAYMRAAMFLHYNDPKDVRMQNIKAKYDQLSMHYITEATPKMVNSLKPNAQMFSCTLMRTDDSSNGINYTANAMGQLSRYGSGLGLDISLIRANNRPINGNNGVSSGPIPFIRMYQEMVSAYDQGGTRKGAAAVYYDWFNYESDDITMLKDAGGKDEERARKLKYAIKWNRVLTERIINDKMVTLFSPDEVKPLIDAYGKEFKEKYEYYEGIKGGIRRKTMKAKDLAFKVAKVRSETGNLYIFFSDNVNEQRMGRDVISQSNLCTEVMLPTKPITTKEEKLVYDFDKNKYIVTKELDGEIALCNLSSVNLVKWLSMTKDEKHKLVSILVRSMDNATINSYYPSKLGEIFMRRHNPIGIGVSNYAQALAINKFKWNSDEAKKFTHELFEEILWYVLYHSSLLAKERGKYELYEGSKWSEGILPFEISKLPDFLSYDLKQDWDTIRKMIKNYGVRFEYHMAIAPTQTSGNIINATEGTEPIRKLKIIKEGTYTLPFLAPNLKQCREYYEFAFDIPNKNILELAAIRQKFIDQAQSINLYYNTTESAGEIINDIIYAEQLGIKSLYYLNPKKAESELDNRKECESCSA